MRRKLTFGWIVFIVGILLEVVSDIADISIIGVLAGIVWPVGMVIGVNASISLAQKKQSNDKSNQLREKDNN